MSVNFTREEERAAAPFYNLKSIRYESNKLFGTITCFAQTIHHPYVDFLAHIKNQCSKDSCVCVVGVVIFGPLFEIWVLIGHGLKSAYKTVYVLVEWMWLVAWNTHSMFCI